MSFWYSFSWSLAFELCGSLLKFRMLFPPHSATVTRPMMRRRDAMRVIQSSRKTRSLPPTVVITVEIKAFDIIFDTAKLEGNVKIRVKVSVRTLAPATEYCTTK